MNLSSLLSIENSWICVTLMDITSTTVTRGESMQRHQQRNWESLLQALSLKTQIEVALAPEKVENFEIKKSNIFGNFYDQVQTVWAFGFYSESNIYTKELLIEDCDNIPMITGLEETARFMLPLTHTRGTLKNIHFMRTPLLIFDK
jgi:hypothetical protein